MDDGPPSGIMPVIEPVRTRRAQIMMCASFVASLVVLRMFDPADPSPAGLLCPPTAIITAIHHLVIIILAFKQRRKFYHAREILNLVPTTARAGVVVSVWVLCCCWLIVSMFYLVNLARPGNRALFVLSGVEAAFVFVIAVMCSRERLELLERREEQPSSILFLVDENGNYVATEGP